MQDIEKQKKIKLFPEISIYIPFCGGYTYKLKFVDTIVMCILFPFFLRRLCGVFNQNCVVGLLNLDI